MPKVYSYIRFSSKAQATGDSLRRQTANTLRWAAKHGHELDDALTYRDLGVGAYDSTNLRTGALGVFLRAAQEGKVPRGSILAIEALDRLTRAEPLDAFRLLSDIVSCGVSIVTVSDERVYDEDSLNGDFASLMLAAALLVRGHEESKRKSDRLKDSYSAKRESGSRRISPSAPHWLRPEGAGWGVIPEHAQTVLEIFELAAKGMGANTIAKRLNEEGRPLVRLSPRTTIGWHRGSLAHLLRSRTVIGEYRPHALNKEGKREPAGDPIPHYYPAVVPEELFWTVQALMTARTKGGLGHRRDTGYGNILGGMLYCGYCGARMHLEKKGPGGLEVALMVTNYFYGCSNAVRHVTECNNRINYLALLLGAPERTKGRFPRPLRLSFLSALFEYLLITGEQLSDAADEELAQAHRSYEAATAKLEDAKVRRGNLVEAVEKRVFTLDETQPRMDGIRGEIAKWQAIRDQALATMKRPDPKDDGWLLDAVEGHMAEILPVIKDPEKDVERAALRTRLLQRIEAIYLYRDCARVKLRHHETPLFIPLVELGAAVADVDRDYPLPAKATSAAMA